VDWLSLLWPPLFAALGGIAVWLVQSRIEELRRLERSLEEPRRKIYMDAVDPFVRLFAGVRDPKVQQQVVKQFGTYDSRKVVFDLMMFGSDDVVRAYNRMMRHTYEVEASGDHDPKRLMELFSQLLLSIRKGLGNSRSRLSHWEMLEALITDIESLKAPTGNSNRS